MSTSPCFNILTINATYLVFKEWHYDELVENASFNARLANDYLLVLETPSGQYWQVKYYVYKWNQTT